LSALPDFAAAIAAGKLRLTTLAAHRLMRLSRSPATEPWWGKNKSYRFDDPAQSYGVTYAALTLDVAFAEAVLHQKGLFVDDHWVLDKARITERHVVGFEHPDAHLGRRLRIADLTGARLKALGLNNDLCSSDDYTHSMAVSNAIYDQVPSADGILYVSRQLNTGLAVALFERSGVQAAALAVPLERHPDFAAVIDLFDVEVLPSGDPQQA
jgi:RES domain